MQLVAHGSANEFYKKISTKTPPNKKGKRFSFFFLHFLKFKKIPKQFCTGSLRDFLKKAAKKVEKLNQRFYLIFEGGRFYFSIIFPTIFFHKRAFWKNQKMFFLMKKNRKTFFSNNFLKKKIEKKMDHHFYVEFCQESIFRILEAIWELL